MQFVLLTMNVNKTRPAALEIEEVSKDSTAENNKPHKCTGK